MRPHGKHVQIDPDSPKALGICDYTGFVHMRKDLVRQMEWRGNALIWTGLYVGRNYQDVPNEQNRPPILPPDPIPVLWPRPPRTTQITWSQGLGIPWNQLSQVTWGTWGTIENGSQALPEGERLQQLQQVRFMGGA
jgi:hypothetical protein